MCCFTTCSKIEQTCCQYRVVKLKIFWSHSIYGGGEELSRVPYSLAQQIAIKSFSKCMFLFTRSQNAMCHPEGNGLGDKFTHL